LGSAVSLLTFLRNRKYQANIFIMKKIYLITIAILALTSCKKGEQLPGDNGCISQIERQNFGVTASDSIAAVQLLKQNNLPTNDLVLEYVHNDTITYTVPSYINQYVFGIQYINGLAILSYDFGYTFKNGVFKEVTGARYSVVNLDTHPTQHLPQLRALYISEISKNRGSDIAAAFKDSCVLAQFGYYDLNVDFNVPVNDHTPNFVKAWSVKPKHAPYPQVIFRDDNGKTIVYNGGPVLFNQ